MSDESDVSSIEPKSKRQLVPMRLVLDTNQVSRLVHVQSSSDDFCPTVVIPPFVWAEILLAPSYYHQERLDAIRKYSVMFGMVIPYVYERLCILTETEIRQFDPVFAADSDEHQQLYASFSSPRQELLDRARQYKQDASADAQNLFDRRAQYRRNDLAAKSKGEDLVYEKMFTDIDDADERFISGKNAQLRSDLVDNITDCGSRSIRASSTESFYEAILDNPQLRRFLRLNITFTLSYADQWTNAGLNRLDPSRNRNDATDITLPLYARDGDVIITEDAFLQRAFRHVDPKCKVKLSTWDAIVSGSNWRKAQED